MLIQILAEQRSIPTSEAINPIESFVDIDRMTPMLVWLCGLLLLVFCSVLFVVLFMTC
ncbi:MAG: hypothetical protein LBQ66_04685 [Planctomycetaceae bacterium]|nr:hypothetical protein [Planctomycetaceae bacterium]